MEFSGDSGIVKNSPFFSYGKKGPGIGGNIGKRTLVCRRKSPPGPPRSPIGGPCDFRRQTRVLFPIPGPLRFACFSPSHLWLGKKTPRGPRSEIGPPRFLSTRSPPKIACDFRGIFFPSINGSLVPSNSFGIEGDDGFPPISKKSEETSKKIPPGAPISDRGPAFFYRPMKWVGKKIPPGAPISDRPPAFFYRPMKWVGKKILRHAPANPFMRFARRAVNLRGPGYGGSKRRGK